MKKITGFILSLLLLISFTPAYEGHAMTSAAKAERTVIVACSDYQAPQGNARGSAIVAGILSQIKTAGYETVDGFFCAGDYDYELPGVETAEGIASLKSTIQSAYPAISEENMIFVQGNHDEADAEGLSAGGAHDTDQYGVYIIHHDDFPWGGGEPEAVQAAAEELDAYLQKKVNERNTLPIFVISHLPLHYSMRTRRGGDGKYAQYLFEVLNRYAVAGQNIVYLYGHNHNSYGYDDYLGTGSVYLTRGDTIYIAKPESTDAIPNAYTLSFTYMNAGYVGYNFSQTPGADTALTMTVFEIVDNIVTVERYSSSGIHNMKARGLWSDNEYLVDSKDNYGADDSYLTVVYKSPQLVGQTITSGSVQAVASGLTGLTVRESAGRTDGSAQKAYVSYDINTEGYEKGEPVTIIVSLDGSYGFDGNQSVFIINRSTGGITTGEIRNGSVTIRTNSIDSFSLAQFEPVSVKTTEQIVYRYSPTRNQFTDGKTYVIVSDHNTGVANAMKNSAGEDISSEPVEVFSDSNGEYINTTDSSVIWKYYLTDANYSRGVGDLQNLDTGRYLYAGDGSIPLAKEDAALDYTYWNISGSLYMYTYENWTNRSGTRWSLKYEDGFILDTEDYSTNQVYIFEEDRVLMEDAVYLSNHTGKVDVHASDDAGTGSTIIIKSHDGLIETADITIQMLRDAQGNSVSTETAGKQKNLCIYYNDTLVYEGFTLQVIHENGEDYLDVAEYRSSEQTAWTYPAKDGYVFAGWYQDAEYTKPLDESTVTGFAYARFVDEAILSVKYQMNALANIDDEAMSLRMLTSVDSLSYRSVGFRIETGTVSADYMSQTVYRSIRANGQSVTPGVFSEDSRYIIGHSLNNIPKRNYGSTLIITPLWVTLDGTTVRGAARTLVIRDDFAVGTNVTNKYSGGNMEYWFYHIKIHANQWVCFDVEGIPVGGAGSVYFFVNSGNNTLESFNNQHPGSKFYYIAKGDKIRFFGQIYGEYEDNTVGIRLFSGHGAQEGDSITVSNLRVTDEPDNALYYNIVHNADGYTDVGEYIPVAASAGQYLTYTVSLEHGNLLNHTGANDPKSWIFANNGSAGAWNSARVTDNGDGTQTVEIQIPEDITNFKPTFDIQNLNGATENKMVISNIQVNDAASMIFIDASRPMWTWDIRAATGDELSFDLESDQPITIQCKLDGANWSTTSLKSNLKGRITVTAVFTADVSSIEMLAAESESWWGAMSAKITNVKIIRAS